MVVTVVRGEPGLNLIERAVGDAQGCQHLIPSCLALALLVNVAPCEPSADDCRENETRCQTLPKNRAIVKLLGAALIALLQDALL